MTRRQEGQRIKQIVQDVTGMKPHYVKSGRGTSCWWWYICVVTEVGQKAEIEKRMVQEKLVGKYLSDCGPGSDWEAQVRWDDWNLPTRRNNDGHR